MRRPGKAGRRREACPTSLWTLNKLDPARTMSLQVMGVLAIQSDVVPIVFLDGTHQARRVSLRVKSAPVGAGLVVRVTLAGAEWLVVTLPDGDVAVEAPDADVSAAGDLIGGDVIGLDVVAVGTTFPGADLSVLIWF